MLNPNKSHIVFEDGDGFFDEEVAIAQLLNEGVLCVTYHRLAYHNNEITKEPTIALSVLLNDIFAYACSDCESIQSEEDLMFLYDHCVKYPRYGFMIWAAKKRNLKPMVPWHDKMRKIGEWPEEMNNLRDNL